MSELRGTSANIGMNLDSISSQKKEGELSFALNAVLEGFDGESVSYQNEAQNILCTKFPDGYKVVGTKFILEKGYSVCFLSNGKGSSEIGKIDKCTYSKIINSSCFGFDISYPIHKIVTKVTNCSTELYWADRGMKYIDLENLPFKETTSEINCDNTLLSTEVDCNKINVQPNFSIPSTEYIRVENDGDLVAGTYQFAVQYATSQGDPYTALYGITQPISINDPKKVTEDFNYPTGKSIIFNISNIDVSGVYDYINIVVIKTVNSIPSPELIETRRIRNDSTTITYTGVSKVDERLSSNEIFETFSVYSKVDGVFSVQDILGWSGLTLPERVNYQTIASKITLQWQSWKLTNYEKDNYSFPINTSDVKGYMRDETYVFGLVLQLTKGRESDFFPIPGRRFILSDLEIINNEDVANSSNVCDTSSQSLPRWKVYNTATRIDFADEYIKSSEKSCYRGPYEYGDFAYTESTDTYPCDKDVWGELAGEPIRHFRFPDNSITHIHDGDGNIYPLGLRIDVNQIKSLIKDDGHLTEDQKKEIVGFKIVRGNRANNASIVAKGLLYNVGKYTKEDRDYFYPNYPFNDLEQDPFLSHSPTGDDSGKNLPIRLEGFSSSDSRQRFTFHSPDTHFYQPFLGNELRLETIEYGKSLGHFVQVKKHSRYKLLSSGSYATSLAVSMLVGFASNSLGLSTNIFNGTAAFTAFSVLLSIIDKSIPRVNTAYQFNSVGKYNNFLPVENDRGNKVRSLDIASYLVSGMTSAGDTHPINNFQRETSVYLRTGKILPFPNELAAPVDSSRWVLSDNDCSNTVRERDISSFYASIKKNLPNQWGTIGSFELIDTGFSRSISFTDNSYEGYASIFGGDVFINKFALKRKIPFFIDNRVGFQDDSDVFYEELGNLAFPTFWMSTNFRQDITGVEEDDSLLKRKFVKRFKELFGVKMNNFDCKNDKFLYQDGKFYLFAYGIPYFYCESEINVDYRQAFNNREGEFYPHVGEDIPDEWLQEINTTILQDNTYFYNKTFSKQNKERNFHRLPLEFKERCEKEYPNRVAYSDRQLNILNYKKNSWLIYRPVSQFPFPLNYGKLISIEGVDNAAILVRFENKSMIYNALITIDTSSPQAAYIGNDKLFKSSPPIDFAETDLGYNGTQNKFFLKTEKGNISVDCVRGEVLVMSGRQAISITGKEYKVEQFFKEHLPFKILKYFPSINIDNHFNGIGVHGVYDNRYSRLILTKLDYIPLADNISLKDNRFYIDKKEIFLYDETYFCNQSFTISFDFDYKRWISFHSYTPNFYIGGNNIFFSGLNNSLSELWEHNTDVTKYNSFYGIIQPYILEYPFSYKKEDELIQCVLDNTRVFKQINGVSRVTVNDRYFSKSVIYNEQQCSGIRKLIPKAKGNLSLYLKYPKYSIDGIEILYEKTDSTYAYNEFWDVVKDSNEPLFIEDCSILDKKINQSNMDYGVRSFKKYPIRGNECKIRHILDDSSDYRFISKFLITTNQIEK